MKINAPIKANTHKIRSIPSGSTFMVGDTIYMKVDPDKVIFNCENCTTLDCLTNYGYFAVNLANGELEMIDTEIAYDTCNCEVNVIV
jgi:hypothetical protein